MTGGKGFEMNSVNLLGRLARDPQIYEPAKKDAPLIAKFTLAVNRDAENADFISCTAFGKTAEVVAEHLRKGTQIAVSGRIQTGSYEKDGKTVYTTDVIVDRVFFAGPKPEAEEEPPKKSGYASRQRK